jgi:hypothetical protein
MNNLHYKDVILCTSYRSSTTTYAKQNGGKYNFIIEPPKALPIEAVSVCVTVLIYVMQHILSFDTKVACVKHATK